jgi:hypothetical protein
MAIIYYSDIPKNVEKRPLFSTISNSKKPGNKVSSPAFAPHVWGASRGQPFLKKDKFHGRTNATRTHTRPQ